MASQFAPVNGFKRKAVDHKQITPSAAARKRQKTQDIRFIPAQSTDAALSVTGELNVASFVKSREYEIKALEKSMQSTRAGLSARAFQQVPRNMRRRTASHNVKKVPRRLRRRAEREMKEDNTPTVTSRRRTPSAKLRLRLQTAKRMTVTNTKYKSAQARKQEAKVSATETDPEARVPTSAVARIKKNKVADPPTATSKFKRRQIHKTWLPTHLWHAKRAHMTRPSEPLWRMAISLSPTEKSYRPTHRSSGGRGVVAWDTSYMATIECEGAEASLLAMLKAVDFTGDFDSGRKGTKWRSGMRSASGWASERDNEKRIIGPVTVIWGVSRKESKETPADNPKQVPNREHDTDTIMQDESAVATPIKAKQKKRKLLIRVHPSAFHQLWAELLTVSKMQRPPVVLADLRFEIASIELIGPASTEALCAVLQPTGDAGSAMSCSAETWTKLAGVSNPASLPLGAVLGFNVTDPRLHHPREQIPVKSEGANDGDEDDHLTDILVEWPPDHAPTSSGMFSHKARRAASRTLASQKAINRRKQLTSPGDAPPPKDDDVSIPVLLLASRPHANAQGAQGKWTVLLPWKCLDPVWRCLMYYPLNSGGTPRFGGLDETRQVASERNEPWFPGDFPGTEAGKAWERTESEQRFNVWNRKPPSRRVNYDSLRLGGGEVKGEHGQGWACDWKFLFCQAGAGKSDVLSKEPRVQILDSNSKAPVADASTAENKASTSAADKGTAHPDENAQASATAPPFTQLDPRRAPSILSLASPSPTTTTLTPSPHPPLIATIFLTLLTRGSPLPGARIYRLPSSTITSSLRTQYLKLDPHHFPAQLPQKKQAINWRNDPATPSTYADEHAALEAIVCHPADMPPEAVKEWERKKAELRRKREKFQRGKVERRLKERLGRGKEKGDGARGEKVGMDVDIEGMNSEEQERLLRELMIPSADANGDQGGDVGSQGLPCPAVEDLIGFVTSGGYNLAVGRGTGVGAIWVQRVLGGWNEEEGKGKMQGGEPVEGGKEGVERGKGGRKK